MATSEDWMDLAVVIDLYSQQVVGWSMSTRRTTTWVCDALSMVLFRRGIPEEVIAILIEVVNIAPKTTENSSQPIT